MVDVKQAIQRAKEYAEQFLDVDPNAILLEEIHPSTKYSSITLSFRARGISPSVDADQPVRSRYDYRELKAFKVIKKTGKVEGMLNVQPI